MRTYTCPVLAFTADVEALYRWFEATHELTNADGRTWWRRTGLPGPGNVGEQDCRLLAELEYLETLTNGLLAMRRAPTAMRAPQTAPTK